jgi:CRISPR-associated endonuclease/helicase Cas3
MEQQFRSIIGYMPHPFQMAVARHLMAGRSVILRAPTGAGKTAAALFPGLLSRGDNFDFPRQAIYSLPLRVLANSLCNTARSVAKDCCVTLQTGESPQDPQFLSGDWVFCTYDQTLSSLLHFPFSLSRRQSNVNAGVWVSSYLVFDEIHLMEMQRALGTTVAALKWLRDTTPFLMMTATMTDAVINWIKDETGAVVVELTRDEFKLLRSRVRVWHHCAQPLTAEKIVSHHQNKSIVVLNQVERAQSLFEELCDLKKQNDPRLSDTDILLVHARFINAHRQAKADLIEQRFGKKSDRVKCILVATQVIEVGLDISCSVLHSELAPANALVQRAGRCARFEGIGHVHVYDWPDDKKRPHLPYDAQLCEKTRASLLRRVRHWKEAAVGFRQELKWVRRVHEEADMAALDLLKKSNRRQQMWETIEAQNDAAYRELVRDIDAVSVIVHPSPDRRVWPYTLEAFSLSSKVLMGFIGKALKTTHEKDAPDEDDEDWERGVEFPDATDVAWWPEDKAGVTDDLYDHPVYEWHPVEKSKDVLKASQLALNPAFASYDSDYGLRLGSAGQWQSPPIVKQSKGETFGFSRTSYEQHITNVWLSYQRCFARPQRLGFAARRLENSLGLQRGDVEMLIAFAIVLHDTAKLTVNWQSELNSYQRAVGATPAALGEWLSHSDYDPSNDKHTEANRKHKRPPHAVEGALANSAVVAAHLQHLLPARRDQLLKVFIAAVATHHSSSADQSRDQILTDQACQEVVRVASFILGRPLETQDRLLLRQIPKRDRIAQQLFPKPQDDVYPLYMLLVRVLRLSDQHSFEGV